jgi:hypothetical protein
VPPGPTPAGGSNTAWGRSSPRPPVLLDDGSGH